MTGTTAPLTQACASSPERQLRGRHERLAPQPVPGPAQGQPGAGLAASGPGRDPGGRPGGRGVAGRARARCPAYPAEPAPRPAFPAGCAPGRGPGCPSSPPQGAPAGSCDQVALIAVTAGLLIGISLGALGGGGSIFTVPALVYLLGQSAHRAVTASLLVVGIAAVTGAIAQARAGRVQLRAGAIFGVLGIAGSDAGSLASAAVPADVLLARFGVLMLAVAAVMIIRRCDQARPAAASPPPAVHGIRSWSRLRLPASGWSPGSSGSAAASSWSPCRCWCSGSTCRPRPEPRWWSSRSTAPPRWRRGPATAAWRWTGPSSGPRSEERRVGK